MANHPNRRQIRLSLTPDEGDALLDLVRFARRLGYHPLTNYVQLLGQDTAIAGLVHKMEAAFGVLVFRPEDDR